MLKRISKATVGGNTPVSAGILEFPSVGAFVNQMRDPKYMAQQAYRNSGTSWAGGESWEESLTLALKGREDWAQKAKDVYDLLETGGIELEIHQWGADRAGAFPVVQDYLAGVPENMRRRLTNQSDLAPVNVYADISASAGFDSDDLTKRGAAILALTMALSQHRPTTLYLVSGLDAASSTGTGAQFIVMKCDTIPMDLAQLAYLFGSAGFFRNLCFAMAQAEYKFVGGWPWGTCEPHSKPHVDKCKAVMGLSPTDLWIPGIYLTDESVTNPVGWITEHLERYKQHIEE